jgi:ketosteroid isomerase-like protein
MARCPRYQTYFDPITEKRIDGREGMKTFFAPFAGKISIERVEIVDPKVQRLGDLAVLTFNLNDYGAQLAGGQKTTARWNSTEDLAYARGAYTATRTDAASQRPVTAKGKYVVVYRKQADGHWKAIHDINNRDS